MCPGFACPPRIREAIARIRFRNSLRKSPMFGCVSFSHAHICFGRCTEADAVPRNTFGSSRCRSSRNSVSRKRAGMHSDCRNVGPLVPDGSLNETQFRGVGLSLKIDGRAMAFHKVHCSASAAAGLVWSRCRMWVLDSGGTDSPTADPVTHSHCSTVDVCHQFDYHTRGVSEWVTLFVCVCVCAGASLIAYIIAIKTIVEEFKIFLHHC